MAWLARMGRRGKSGFTLIEILIALVVLFIGIVGIIALFPIGIESTKASVQDTNAALIAESIHHALIIAMRNPINGQVWLVHDGVPIAGAGPFNGRPAYPINLDPPAPTQHPSLLPAENDWDHHPWPNPGQANGHGAPNVTYSAGMGPPSPLFQLGRERTLAANDPIVDSVEDMRGATYVNAASGLTGSDPTVDYSQYYWDFWIQRVADAAGVGLPLYQFRIRIWRDYPAAATVSATAWDHRTWGAAGAPRQLIQEFRVLVASN